MELKMKMMLIVLICYLTFPITSFGNQNTQYGIASWYGGKFHGRKTASGEQYDMYKFTAAHKNLPFGTFVSVTNLGNGKSVVVKINDRGPFVKGRIIDLSYVAAKKIDLHGIAKVKVEVIEHDKINYAFNRNYLKLDNYFTNSNKRRSSVKNNRNSKKIYQIEIKPIQKQDVYMIQLASFKDAENALLETKKYSRINLPTTIIFQEGYNSVFKVLLDYRFRNLESARKYLDVLLSKNFSGFIIRL